ncbi:MAG: DUF421 domain-containing protein [Rhodothermales bacterium]|nr:DUF421 domain-containing protein [Rhodothermales bacterium]
MPDLVPSGTVLLGVLISTVGIYVGVVVLTRLLGLRSFSKMSSFDFAVTVAIGSVVASTAVSGSVPVVQGLAALALLYALQFTVGIARNRLRAEGAIDNQPLVLMVGPDFIEENLRRAHVTENDIRSKLRLANVTRMEQVRAVVMETTGDVSILHADPSAPPLDAALFENVRGADRLAAAGIVRERSGP